MRPPSPPPFTPYGEGRWRFHVPDLDARHFLGGRQQVIHAARGDVAEDLHLAGHRIHLDDRDVGAPRKLSLA